LKGHGLATENILPRYLPKGRLLLQDVPEGCLMLLKAKAVGTIATVTMAALAMVAIAAGNKQRRQQQCWW
jgi:hypothetical protein